jgi:hypothetical protein
MDNRFYVYEHRRPDTGAVFYVGKGTGKRAYNMDKRSQAHHAYRRELGYKVDVVIYRDGLTEDEAFALEVAHIASLQAQGIALINVLAGGAGGRYRGPASEAVKARLRAQAQRRKWDRWFAKIDAAA